MADLTAESLKQLIHYDPATGAFTRIAALNWKGDRIAPRSSSTGSVLARGGYATVRVGGRDKRYLAHRLAWFYVYGEWPKGEIDHINGDKLDNRLANLRDGSHAQNCQNVRAALRNNGTGLLGVSWDRSRSKFAASIQARGLRVNLGRYDTAEAAHAAYLKAKRELHEFATV